MSSVLMILHTTVIKNSLFYLFRFIEKNEKRISDCFIEQCSHIFVLFYVSDLTCIHVDLCSSSSRQILATPLTRGQLDDAC